MDSVQGYISVRTETLLLSLLIYPLHKESESGGWKSELKRKNSVAKVTSAVDSVERWLLFLRQSLCPFSTSYHRPYLYPSSHLSFLQRFRNPKFQPL
ncbi:hypothetical protein SLA2020_257520 [Shorea laevis]